MRRFPPRTTTRSPEEVAQRQRTLEAKLAPPGEPDIEAWEDTHIRITAAKVPPNLLREHLPNVRKRHLGPSRWSVSEDWANWAILWGGQARIRAGWPIAKPGDRVRLVVTLHRVALLDELDNKGASVKPVIDGLQRIRKPSRVIKGRAYPEERGAGLIDNDKTLHPAVCRVRQVPVRHRAEQRMVIELWRLTEGEYQAILARAAAEDDAP